MTFIGKWIYLEIMELGRICLFVWESLMLMFKPPHRIGEFFKHMYFVLNQSILIICLTSFFTGMVFSYQVYLGFKIINSGNLVGPTVGMGIFRELGPVLTGLIVSARAGGAMAARLGTMRVTEQIDALSVMGVYPKQYLVAPRVLAAIVSMPLLNAVFCFMAMVGSYIVCVYLLGLDPAIFINKLQLWLDPKHLVEGLYKAAFFGMIFGSICSYKGYYTKGGAKGVGDATNAGVVYSMILIIVSDFFLTKMFGYIVRIFE
jgi:phospholipid/cholesterol/gamma-HCH transport system permease protein